MTIKNKNKMHYTGNQTRVGMKRIFSASLGKVGTTAGFTVRAANNTDYATVAASQTAATFVLPLNGLNVGDKIEAFSLIGQIESAGNTVTVDANLRKSTAVAADPTDASIDSITQLSVTADTAMSESNTKKTLSTPETIVAGVNYYLLITVTTAASTDVVLQGALVQYTQN